MIKTKDADYTPKAFELVLLNRSYPIAGKEAFKRNQTDRHEMRQGKHLVLKLCKDLPNELKQKLDWTESSLPNQARIIFGGTGHYESGGGNENSSPTSPRLRPQS